jgi:hypothetical protein
MNTKTFKIINYLNIFDESKKETNIYEIIDGKNLLKNYVNIEYPIYLNGIEVNIEEELVSAGKVYERFITPEGGKAQEWVSAALAVAFVVATGGTGASIWSGIKALGYTAAIAYGISKAVDYLNRSNPNDPMAGWDGIANTTMQQGQPIPVLYGTYEIGGNIVSKNLYSGYRTGQKKDKMYLDILVSLTNHYIPSLSTSSIKLNGSNISSVSKYDLAVYKGTNDQTVDPDFNVVQTFKTINQRITTSNSPFIITTDSNTVQNVRLNISFKKGLYSFNKSNGSYSDLSVTFRLKAKITGEADWQVSKNYTITSKTAGNLPNTIDFAKHFVTESPVIFGNDVTPNQFTIYIERVTSDEISSNQQNESYIDEIEERYYKKLDYPNRSLIAIKGLSADDFGGAIPSVSVLGSREAITALDIFVDPYFLTPYESSTGVFRDKYFYNPAFVIIDILTNKNYSDAKLTMDNIDIPAFENYAKFCDDNNIRIGCVFADKKDVLSTAMLVASENSAGLVPKGNKMSIVIDTYNVDPVQLFNDGNIKANSLNIDYISEEELPNAIDVTFINADHGFVKEQFKIYGDNWSQENERTKSVSLNTITNYDRAVAQMTKLLKHNHYCRERISFEVDLDALSATINDLIYVTHSSINFSEGEAQGRLKKVTFVTGLIYKIEIDTSLNVVSGNTYSILVRNSDDELKVYSFTAAITGSITEFNITLGATDTILKQFDIYSIYPNTNIISIYKINSITRSSELSRKVTATNFDTRVYTDDVIAPSITAYNVDVSAKRLKFNLCCDRAKYNGDVYARLNWDVDAAQQVDTWKVYYRKANTTDDWSLYKDNIFSNYTDVLIPFETGVEYEFAVAGKSLVAEETPDAASNIAEVINSPYLPSDVTNFAGNFTGKLLNLSWDLIEEPFIEGYELRRSLTDVGFDLADFFAFTKDDYITVDMLSEYGGNGKNYYYYYIKARTTQKTFSDIEASLYLGKVAPTDIASITGTVYDKTLNLTWTNSTGATYYKIKRALADIGYNSANDFLNEVYGLTKTYDFSNGEGNSYYYYIKGVDEFGQESANAQKVLVTVTLPDQISSFEVSPDRENFVFTFNFITQNFYEIEVRYGTSWETSSEFVLFKTTKTTKYQFNMLEKFGTAGGDSRNFYVKTTNAFGQYCANAALEFNWTEPSTETPFQLSFYYKYRDAIRFTLNWPDDVFQSYDSKYIKEMIFYNTSPTDSYIYKTNYIPNSSTENFPNEIFHYSNIGSRLNNLHFAIKTYFKNIYLGAPFILPTGYPVPEAGYSFIRYVQGYNLIKFKISVSENQEPNIKYAVVEKYINNILIGVENIFGDNFYETVVDYGDNDRSLPCKIRVYIVDNIEAKSTTYTDSDEVYPLTFKLTDYSFDYPILSGFEWSGEGTDTISWSANGKINYKGTVYNIAAGSITYPTNKYIYWESSGAGTNQNVFVVSATKPALDTTKTWVVGIIDFIGSGYTFSVVKGEKIFHAGLLQAATITAENIQANAVTTEKINTGAVTIGKVNYNYVNGSNETTIDDSGINMFSAIGKIKINSNTGIAIGDYDNDINEAVKSNIETENIVALIPFHRETIVEEIEGLNPITSLGTDVETLETDDGTLFGADCIVSKDSINGGIAVSKATTNLLSLEQAEGLGIAFNNTTIVGSYEDTKKYTTYRNGAGNSNGVWFIKTATVGQTYARQIKVRAKSDSAVGKYVTFGSYYNWPTIYHNIKLTKDWQIAYISDTAAAVDDHTFLWGRYVNVSFPQILANLSENDEYDICEVMLETGTYITPFVLPNWNLMTYNESNGDCYDVNTVHVTYTAGGFKNFPYTTVTVTNAGPDNAYVYLKSSVDNGVFYRYKLRIKANSANEVGKYVYFYFLNHGVTNGTAKKIVLTADWAEYEIHGTTTSASGVPAILLNYSTSSHSNLTLNDKIDICMIQVATSDKPFRFGGASRERGVLLYPSNLFNPSQGSIIIKFKPFFTYATAGIYKVLFEIGETGDTNNFHIAYNYATYQFYFYYTVASVSSGLVNITDAFTGDSQVQKDWLLVVTYDSTSLKFYLDGVLKYTYNITGKPFATLLAQRAYHYFGNYYNELYPSDCVFKEFRTENIALTAEQVKNLYSKNNYTVGTSGYSAAGTIINKYGVITKSKNGAVELNNILAQLIIRDDNQNEVVKLGKNAVSNGVTGLYAKGNILLESASTGNRISLDLVNNTALQIYSATQKIIDIGLNTLGTGNQGILINDSSGDAILKAGINAINETSDGIQILKGAINLTSGSNNIDIDPINYIRVKSGTETFFQVITNPAAGQGGIFVSVLDRTSAALFNNSSDKYTMQLKNSNTAKLTLHVDGKSLFQNEIKQLTGDTLLYNNSLKISADGGTTTCTINMSSSVLNFDKSCKITGALEVTTTLKSGAITANGAINAGSNDISGGTITGSSLVSTDGVSAAGNIACNLLTGKVRSSTTTLNIDVSSGNICYIGGNSGSTNKINSYRFYDGTSSASLTDIYCKDLYPATIQPTSSYKSTDGSTGATKNFTDGSGVKWVFKNGLLISRTV